MNHNMSISYKLVERLIEGSEKKDISILLPDEYKQVQFFLNGTMIKTNDETINWVIQGIEEVIDGKSETLDRDGDVYGLEIKKDLTRAYNIFDDEKDIVNECTIETNSLLELAKEWRKELQNFRLK